MLIKAIIEVVFSVGLFVNAGLFIPQLIKLYRTQDTQGLSLITFAGFSILQIFTFLHGYLHDDYLLMLGMGASFLACGSLTALLIFYQVKQRNR